MDWGSLQGLLSIAGIAWVVISIYFIIRRITQGFWKLGLKESWMGTVMLMGMLWACFALIFFVISVPPVMDWIEASSLSRSSPDTLWVINILPFFYTLSGLTLILYILTKAILYKPKYSEEEQVLLKDEKLKWKKKLGWFGRFIKVED